MTLESFAPFCAATRHTAVEIGTEPSSIPPAASTFHSRIASYTASPTITLPAPSSVTALRSM